MTTAWLMLAISILLNTAGNLLVKRFSESVTVHGLFDFLSPSFVFGIAAFGLGVVFYSRALRQIPIVMAYPIQVGACILLIAAFAVASFGERLAATDALGIILILAGIALLARLA
jgi:undecaprenyl phosphate-alpha-L-ara4N flippase subunit ArnE